jgi:hypothetical protein
MKAANIVGWAGVLLTTAVASFWSYWGVNEAFHEGWCKPYLWMRLLQTLAYLSLAIVFCSLAVLSIRWPRLGAILYALVGLGILTWIIKTGARFPLVLSSLLTLIPILFGLLFLIGRPLPRRLAYAISIGFPVVLVVGFGTEPVIRISTRYDDGDREERLVQGNGVSLLWAPDGPGWSRQGLVSWDEAMRRARHLTEDGKNLADDPQNVWRLPSREELVRSMTRGGKNAVGTWDPQKQTAKYERRPDKESPLWDPYAPLIYFWTSEEASKESAWIVVYHGGVFTKRKATGSSSLGFRAVRAPFSK